MALLMPECPHCGGRAVNVTTYSDPIPCYLCISPYCGREFTEGEEWQDIADEEVEVEVSLAARIRQWISRVLDSICKTFSALWGSQ